MGIYAEDPTLPEEEEIYVVVKTTIPSAADIAITIIAWTASPFNSPISTILYIAKDGYLETAPFLPTSHSFYCNYMWFETAPFSLASISQPLLFPHFNQYDYSKG